MSSRVGVLRVFWGAASIVIAVAACVSGCTTDRSSTSGSDLTSAHATIGDAELRVVTDLPAPADMASSSDTKIAPNDLLQINVFQVADLNREVRVGGDGAISLPLIGSLMAAGKTTTELEEALEAGYGATYLRSPEIAVFRKESLGSRITLDGQFMRPGLYQSTAQSTLLQLVAEAGGMTRMADETKVYVYRRIGASRQVANYSVKDIRTGRRADPKLHGGDVVVAFTSSSKVAFQNLKEALGMASSASRLAVF